MSKQLASVSVGDKKDKIIRILKAGNDKLQIRLDYVEEHLWQMTTTVCESNKKHVQLPVESFDKRGLIESSRESIINAYP